MNFWQFLNQWSTVQDIWLEQVMGNFIWLSLWGLIIILVLIFIFWFMKENIKARIRWEKAKDVIKWYMDNKKESELNDKNIS